MGSATNSLTEPSSTFLSPANRFYRTVWRWHFYAGLFVIPFMIVLAITGSIYLFKPQLDTLMYRNLLIVPPAATIVPYTEQLAAVQQAYPESAVTQFTPNVAPNRSAEVALTTPDDRNLMVFVDPYTAKILGDRDEAYNLQALVRKIHGELMIGRFGDALIELAACWGLVLLITGLYLWWPRQRFTVGGTLIPRVWSKNKRIVWRDLHAVPGFYGVLLIGFLILTGLPWSGFWGETFAQVWGRFPDPMWDEVPQSTVLTGSLNQHGNPVVPWATEQLPLPQSETTGHANHAEHSNTESTQLGQSRSVDLDSVVALAQAEGAPPGFNISFPADETGVYTVSAFPNDPTQEITLHIDQYSGQMLAEVRWQDYGIVPKAVELGVAIHMGKYFGLGNQLLMLFACLIAIVSSVSGLVLWWQRRPQSSSSIGAPPLPPYVQHWKVPIAIIAVLGILFPLVGLSLVIVLLLDYVVLSRIPALKHIFN